MKKKIGFDYTGRDNTIDTQVQKVIPEQKMLEKSLLGGQSLVSEAHLNLITKINGIANMIAEPTFSSLPEAQKTTYIQTLIETVALETELSTKNSILGIK